MNTATDDKPLPQRILRFSKGMVALSIICIAVGGVLIMKTTGYAMIGGVIGCAVGFGIFFTAGYYWACGNESCS